MERFIMKKLKKWKNSKTRKPLILRGARQVGKTYILKQFGEENYKDIAYYDLFKNTKDPKRIPEFAI